MPPSEYRTRQALTFSLGVLILTVALFAPFGAVFWTYEYTPETVTPNDPHLESRLSWPDKTAVCTQGDVECELSYRIKANGSQVVSGETYHASTGFDDRTTLVVFRDATPAFYRPTATPTGNDTARVNLEPVSNATALELASTSASDFPVGIERLVENGRLRSVQPLAGYALWGYTDAIVAHEGKYYDQHRFRYRGAMQWTANIFRFFTLVVGAVIVFYAGRME